ncbi:hypothetical protein C8R44DRAFT_752980 [Mycena epipterygia]|nr:hypothetical protein C8R44DRAFT_752980 [Mycena epipterygia]
MAEAEENPVVDALAALRHTHIDSVDFKAAHARISELIEGREEIAAAYFLLQERMLTLERAYAALTKEHNELLADYATMTKEYNTRQFCLIVFGTYPITIPGFCIPALTLSISKNASLHPSAMDDHDDDALIDYTGASRAELLEAFKVAQQESTNLRAEIRTLCDEKSQLLAAGSSKKRRGQLDDKQREYQGQMISWAKRVLFRIHSFSRSGPLSQCRVMTHIGMGNFPNCFGQEPSPIGVDLDMQNRIHVREGRGGQAIKEKYSRCI